MQFKDTLNEFCDFKEADWAAKTKGRPAKLKTIQELYEKRQKIKYLKWKNLQELLQFIPPIYHDFYKEIPHQKEQNIKQKSRKRNKNNTLECDDSSSEEYDDNGRFHIISDDE